MLSDTGVSVSPARMLLVGDDARAATMMIEMLRDGWSGGLLVTQTAHVADALHELADHGDSCVLLHLGDPGGDLAPLRALVAAAPDAAVLVVSDRDDALDVSAVTAGAQDHLLRAELNPAQLARAVRFARERKRTEVRLTRQALEDALTGLPNRVLFCDRVGVALDRSRRTGLAPAVMFLDVDSFKAVNDSLGHAAGDRLLCTLAQRFQALLRPMDTVARLGGDEFTFLFEGLSGRAEAAAIARRVIEAASEPVVLKAAAIATSVAVSVGVTMLTDPRVACDDALAEADTAMYRAKSLGGGRAEMSGEGAGADVPTVGREPPSAAAPDPAPPSAAAPVPTPAPTSTRDPAPASTPAPDPVPASTSVLDPAPPAPTSPSGAGPAASVRRASLAAVADPAPLPVEVRVTPATPLGSLDEQALRTALGEDQLRVHYQPRVSIDGRTGLVGFEALVRWEHPARGLLVPAEFMDVAERSGLVVDLGDWVIEQALRQVRRWRQTRPGMTISVNLSRRQLADPELGARIRDHLRAARTDPSVLWLELAEEALLADPELAARALGTLSDIGVGLAIDDFGRGPAGAERLEALPVEMLKIDRGVIARLAGPSPDGELVEAVVELGHELGLSVVAEGVETDRQLAEVRDLGCDGAQGYLFSRPVPEDSVRELLSAR